MRQPIDFSQFPRLGKRAPRLDPRTLKLANYLPKAALGAPPTATDWQSKVTSWPMDLNDTLGDCVCAGGAHAVQQWTTYAGAPFVPTDSDVLKSYEDVGGYVPGDPSTDNGCDMLTYLNYFRQTGIGGHKIAAFVSLDPTNDNEVRWAIALFGNCFIGLELPISVQGKATWQVPDGGPVGDGSPGSWGGHCVDIVARNGTREWVVTWGGLLAMSSVFRRTYADEAYAIISPDFIEANGQDPAGIDMVTLENDLALITK